MFYVVTETYLNPTSPGRAYGSETYSIEEHDKRPRTGNYNNVRYCYSDGFETEEEAQLALDALDDDAELMPPLMTENWLFSVVQESISAETSDQEIEDLLKEWDDDARNEQEPMTIDFNVGREMCERVREEATW